MVLRLAERGISPRDLDDMDPLMVDAILDVMRAEGEAR